ncbi:hypothetical protein NDU88_004499 [Pleurodeles waltl]|uniref:Uncharacterized protein n=1 Tax=Pleurodeles waltl TaxID=8319 RepID=A0AAV7TSQ5_PLEWA|nr:hypothetical protein NDU88_004499 [Pleurodeles waltl]
MSDTPAVIAARKQLALVMKKTLAISFSSTKEALTWTRCAEVTRKQMPVREGGGAEPRRQGGSCARPRQRPAAELVLPSRTGPPEQNWPSRASRSSPGTGSAELQAGRSSAMTRRLFVQAHPVSQQASCFTEHGSKNTAKALPCRPCLFSIN